MKKYLALPLFCLMSYSITTAAEAAVKTPHTHAKAPHVHAAVVTHAPAVGVNVGVAVPPRIAIQAPKMVVVPGGNIHVYMTPKIAGLYFYDSCWYRYYGGSWFRATAYNGEWVSIAVAPAAVVAINPLTETRSQAATYVKPEAPVVEQTAIVAPAVATVEVNVATPPILEIQPPELVVVPSGDTYIYMIPTVVGVYFYDGYWYRYYEGAWFRADIYNGPWIGIAVAPTVIVGIDPFYPFYLPASYYRIGYADFHVHWRNWGHDRHWHNHAWFKHEMKPLVQKKRLSSIKADRSKGIDPLKKSLTAKKETLKSSKSLKSGKGKKGDQSLKGVKSVKSNKSNKKDQLNKDSNAKSAKTNKSIAKKSGKIKKSDLTVKGDKLNADSKTKLAKTNKGISSSKKSSIKNGDLAVKSELANKNVADKSDKIAKSDLTVKNSQTIKDNETLKSANTLKSNQSVKGTQKLKDAQTFKKSETLTNVQSNKNLQTSKNIQGNKSVNMLTKQHTQPRQNVMQKTNGFDRR